MSPDSLHECSKYVVKMLSATEGLNEISRHTCLVMEPKYRVVRPRHVHLGLWHHIGLHAVEHAQHGEAVFILFPFKD